jgi:hypothetical protein
VSFVRIGVADVVQHYAKSTDAIVSSNPRLPRRSTALDGTAAIGAA